MSSQTSLSTADFSNFHVQQELQGGQFVSAETSLIAAGAPTISGAGAFSTGTESSIGSAYPIGLIENAGISQSKQLQKIFEVGSSRSYFIPGRVMGSVSLGRIFYYGPSLLRVMYSYYSDSGSISGTPIGLGPSLTDVVLEDGSKAQNPYTRLLNNGQTNFHKVHMSPGEDYFYINLASDMFNQPTGLAFYFKDANFNSVGAFYLEQLYVQGHQFSISSGSVLVMEGASAQYDRIVPIKILNASTS